MYLVVWETLRGSIDPTSQDLPIERGKALSGRGRVHSSQELTLTLRTSVDQRASDEYFGFSDLKIWLDTSERPQLMCAQAIEHKSPALRLNCGNKVITSISFASYGTAAQAKGGMGKIIGGGVCRPAGTSAPYTIDPKCHAESSMKVIRSLCIKQKGLSECTVAPANSVFGER